MMLAFATLTQRGGDAWKQLLFIRAFITFILAVIVCVALPCAGRARNGYKTS